MAPDFNAMLQRSLPEQGLPEPVAEAPGHPPPSIGEVAIA
jgi:U6 snRNA-associated Sm-like protein LSm1